MVMLELFNFIHFIGLALGLGGATIASIISIKAEKDKEVGLAYYKIIPSISKTIWIGLILLFISGIALPFFIKWSMNRQLLIIKHILVVWIVIIGILINLSSKKIKNLQISHSKPQEKSFELLKIKKSIKILSMTNLFLWYVVALLSVFV